MKMAMESESALVGGTRCAEKFDEAGQRDAEAHAADDELKCIDEARVSEFRALMQIEKAERRDDQRQDDTRQNVSRWAGQVESPRGDGYYSRRGTRSSDEGDGGAG